MLPDRGPARLAAWGAVAVAVALLHNRLWATFNLAFFTAISKNLGRNPFGNLQARYRGSPDDDALNRRVARYAADPAARARFAADTMGVPVIRPRNVETTAMGAAYLAGIQAGTWANADEVAAHWQADRVFEPKLPEDDRQEILAMWRSAVGRVLTRGGA